MTTANKRNLRMEDEQPTTDKILDLSGKILDIPFKNEKNIRLT